MQTERIAELLLPFLESPLTQAQLKCISIYVDILLKWNARTNLTAVRQPDEIITRHFGESFFAAQRLFPTESGEAGQAVDVGSGAGFPGLPLAIWHRGLSVTLIESHQKKLTFLREVVRSLSLPRVSVFGGRAENFPGAEAGIVTMRAVERFESVLPTAARLLAPRGRIALLIGRNQTTKARDLLPQFTWKPPALVPGSAARVLLLGESTVLHPPSEPTL